MWTLPYMKKQLWLWLPSHDVLQYIQILFLFFVVETFTCFEVRLGWLNNKLLSSFSVD